MIIKQQLPLRATHSSILAGNNRHRQNYNKKNTPNKQTTLRKTHILNQKIHAYTYKPKEVRRDLHALTRTIGPGRSNKSEVRYTTGRDRDAEKKLKVQLETEINKQ